MAVLSIEDLSLEIAYRDSAHGGISYDICLRWRGEPVLNDAALKRHNKNPWAQRPAGAIEPCDSGREILPFLRKVLETNKSDYWVPDDSDIVLTIYTDDDVPFLPPKWTLLWEKPELTAEREARDAMRAKCGPLPDDLVEMILFVDAYNFAGAGLYYGDGVCFKLRPTRACLQKFYNELHGEYAALRARHGVSATDRDDF